MVAPFLLNSFFTSGCTRAEFTFSQSAWAVIKILLKRGLSFGIVNYNYSFMTSIFRNASSIVSDQFHCTCTALPRWNSAHLQLFIKLSHVIGIDFFVLLSAILFGFT